MNVCQKEGRVKQKNDQKSKPRKTLAIVTTEKSKLTQKKATAEKRKRKLLLKFVFNDLASNDFIFTNLNLYKFFREGFDLLYVLFLDGGMDGYCCVGVG